ncbi:MAG: glycerophosphodiester phosphodiesterase [Pyrinomonadaceae bacterium]
MSESPLIIGHRGASAVAPENTLAAFERAMQDGADGVEFDVRLSHDGVPVVIHDATLTRTAAINAFVGDFSSEELQRIDVGSWFVRRRKESKVELAPQTVPMLHQVFDFFHEREGLLYLEMKSDRSEGSILAAATVRTIRQYSMNERVIVSSFDLSLVKEVKGIDSGIRTSALFEPKTLRSAALVRSRLVERAGASGADEIALHHTLASRSLIETAHQAQLDVVVWTVDNPKWIERARSLGIKALMTNDPAGMLRVRGLSSTV